jgi:DNA-binding LytR/AlgR family response regulator
MNAPLALHPRRWLMQWSRGDLAPRQWLEALALLATVAGLYCVASSIGFGSLPRPGLALAWGAWLSVCLGIAGWTYLEVKRRMAVDDSPRRRALGLVLLALPLLMAVGERLLAALYWQDPFTLTADHALSRLPFSLLLLAAIELPIWIRPRLDPEPGHGAADADVPLQSATPAPSFRIPTRRGVRVLAAADVNAVRSAGNYVEFFAHGEVLLLRETLSNIEAALAPHGFLRVHRSHLVRLSEIDSLQKHRRHGWSLRLRLGIDVPVGRAFQPAVEQALVPTR